MQPFEFPRTTDDLLLELLATMTSEKLRLLRDWCNEILETRRINPEGLGDPDLQLL